MDWLLMAVLSAVFAGLTSVLAKCGIRKTDSDVATALRTAVVLLFSWIMVFITGAQSGLTGISGKNLLFLVLSGIATGASWLCYFKALSMGDVNKVVPIDKSSTILTVILAIIFFNEHDNIAIRLLCTAVLGAGIFLMIEKKKSEENVGNKRWMLYAVLSAVFASLTSILAKVGVTGVDSNLATAIRTFVVLIMAWLVVFVQGKQKTLDSLDKKELIFIFLSGIATGASWLCYYYAIHHGEVSVVVPIDKLSIVVAVGFSYIVFKEKLTIRSFAGLLLMVLATFVMAIAT